MRYYKKLSVAKNNLSTSQLLLARDIIYEGDIIKYYYVFDSYQEYEEYIKDIPIEQRNFYEVINSIQRLYMDIDIPDNNIQVHNQGIHALIQNIQSIYPDAVINVYTSHRETKSSYHVIILNYYVYDNIQCKTRIGKILESFSDPIKQYIDMKIYRKNQLLRLIGNCKIGISNTKIQYIGIPNNGLVCELQENMTILPYLDVEYPTPDIQKQARMFYMKRISRGLK